MGKNYFIAANHTGAGKTLISALLVQGLRADYWKPIQAGELDNSDTLWVQKMVDQGITMHPETFRLKTAASPHYAASLEGITITAAQLNLPFTANTLIIESAGGILSPVSDDLLMIDLAKQYDAEVIFISRHYLGSINHTLLSLEALQSRNIPVKGIIFNGSDKTHEPWILQKTGVTFLGSLPEVDEITPEVFREMGPYVKWDLLE